MTELPSKQELLSYQARWMRRAGTAAVAGAFIITVSIVIGRIGLDFPSADSDADQLAFVHAHYSRLLLSSVIQAVGFALLMVPLLFLFRSASGRSERVRAAFVGLIVLGPLAYGIGLVFSPIATSDTADKFAAQAPAVEQRARQQAEAPSAAAAKPNPKPKQTKKASGTTTGPAGGATSGAQPKTPDQAASDARENLADTLNKKTSALEVVGGVTSLVGALSLVFGLIYTSLWAMRTGLLTRFWGMLGVAFGIFVVIPIFPAVPGIVLWFAAIGLMFLGVWPRPMPPAWAVGEAISWPRPGEDIGPPPERPGPGGTVEGSGREVAEPPLPEDGTAAGQPDEPAGETQGERRKKRKRRG
ncbi:MAG: hypothetical protein ACJ75Z_03315 [Solirubrobacterales bacterium]